MSVTNRKLAIGLPVYNGEDVLAAALDALLAQTYGDFDLIISDNASDDGTQDICRDYAARDTRIRYIRQPRNLGAVPNFNRVFELSNSRYFKWAACDDICAPTFLEKAVALLDARPDVAWCHSRSSHIDPAGQLLDEPDALDVSYAERESARAHQRFRAVLLGTQGSLDSYGVMRSDAVRKTPLYLSNYGAEKSLVAELALLGRYAEIPETLFFARVTPKGSGNLKTAEEQQAFIDPSRKAKPSMARLRYLAGYLAAIRRPAPTPLEATLCRLVVLQWVMQVSKWRSVAVRTLTGRGLGGRNIERLERLKADSGNGRTGKPTGAVGDRNAKLSTALKD